MKLFKKRDIRNEFLPSAIEIIETPESPWGKLIIGAISLLILSAITWAILGKVDEVAVARGKVIPDGNVKVVQALEGGSVTSIDVKEGQKVEKGQVLMKLDTRILQDEKEKIESSLNIAKLEKNLVSSTVNGGNSNVDADSTITQEIVDSEKKYNDVKNQEYLQKQKSYDSNIEKSIKELEIEKKNLEIIEGNINKLTEDIEKIKTAYEGKPLPEELLAKRNADIELEKKRLEAQKNNIASFEEKVEFAKNEKEVFAIDYNKNNMREIVEKDKVIQQLESELSKIKKRIEMQTVVAPVGGTIQSVSENTVGGVVAPGKSIVSIVPEESALLVEVLILNEDIGFVKKGQTTEIKLDAFPFQQYGAIKGEIIHISPDAIQNETMGYVYKALIKPEKSSILVDEKEVNISSGMTVVAEAKTGERRIIEFFIPGLKEIKEVFELR